MRIRTLPLVAASLVMTGGHLRAQDTVSFPAQDHVAIRAMRSVPVNDLGGLHLHTVVGATGSVSFGELDSGGTTGPAHHHTREQGDVGLTGTLEATLGNHIEQLQPGFGVIIPADVMHGFVNRGPGRVTGIEFHTVRRPDLVPGQPHASYPTAPSPVDVPDNRRLIVPLNTTQGETITGATCLLRWRWVGDSVDMHPQTTLTELYMYVVQGEIRLTAEGRSTRVPEGSLLVIPAKERHVRVEAVGGARAGLIEFQVRR